uniref:ATP-dependent RNA helicase RhlB n=1 Tax=Candidatus Kentrum sp. TUN TaxID=2126343 RepID=A0A450ZED9_9GAMM|nr:MAG: ATP-dependent RNA helicase RhlB [Candidatus Kentron sp. TUN]VFK52699.1 MAG: ATP-dependent RNA helicase RhlB [Candidatus Kentron sp. TUN]VFK53271.1 MAG: ATP-dependent RNA helicase RhlB [Candidatus Kentron sp. TUN]
MSGKLLTDLAFSELDLESSLQKGIAQAGFSYCTSIQAKTLPLALDGIDVEGQAQTGTGKTAAFLIATMNYLLRTDPFPDYQGIEPRSLILVPTRELAIQIHKDALLLASHTKLRIGVVYGGTGYKSQREMVSSGLDILIGTPGRLIDYYKQHVFSLDNIQVAVLDEADRMFDLGFIRDIRYLLRRIPPAEARLNMLFSATLSLRVSELAYEHLNAPIVVNVSSEKITVDKVRQSIYHISKEEKIPLLIGLLQRINATRTLIFTNTKRTAEYVEAWLNGNDFQAGLLTGDVQQKTRLKLLDQFLRGKLPILVATDVAARGLHIPNVSHVFNYDLPQDSEDYVHRIGRTARAGATGHAVSFACDEYVFTLTDIEEFIDQRIPVEQVFDELLVTPKPPKAYSGKAKNRRGHRAVGNTQKRKKSATGSNHRRRRSKNP